MPQRLETVTIRDSNEGEVYPNLTVGTPISIQAYSGTNSLTNYDVNTGLTLDSSVEYRFG